MKFVVTGMSRGQLSQWSNFVFEKVYGLMGHKPFPVQDQTMGHPFTVGSWRFNLGPIGKV